MQLYENWTLIARKSWAVRFSLLAALLSGLEVVCSVFTDSPPIDRTTFAAVAFVITIAAAVARLVAQKDI